MLRPGSARFCGFNVRLLLHFAEAVDVYPEFATAFNIVCAIYPVSRAPSCAALSIGMLWIEIGMSIGMPTVLVATI